MRVWEDEGCVAYPNYAFPYACHDSQTASQQSRKSARQPGSKPKKTKVEASWGQDHLSLPCRALLLTGFDLSPHAVSVLPPKRGAQATGRQLEGKRKSNGQGLCRRSAPRHADKCSHTLVIYTAYTPTCNIQRLWPHRLCNVMQRDMMYDNTES